MTLIPPGAHLGESPFPFPFLTFIPLRRSEMGSCRSRLTKPAPVDLPPPRPEDDPREPSPAVSSRRGTRTPSRAHHSPSASRAASPTRGAEPRPSSVVLDGSGPTLLQPIPKHPTSPPVQSHTSCASPHMPHPHHHSRPASPAASIHSSTSAIFERDIELPAVASLSLNPNPAQPHTLHHKSSRLSHLSHGSALDHTVPAVLDDAVEALSARSQGNLDGLEIEAPAAGMGVSMARQSSASLHQIGSSPRKTSSGPGGVGLPLVGGSGTFHSRSPSPISVASRASSSVASPAHSPPIMGQLSAQQLQQMALPPPMKTGSTSPTASVPRPPMPGRVSTGPQLPGAWSGSFSAQGTSEKLVDGSPMSQSTPLARENTSPIAEEVSSKAHSHRDEADISDAITRAAADTAECHPSAPDSLKGQASHLVYLIQRPASFCSHIHHTSRRDHFRQFVARSSPRHRVAEHDESLAYPASANALSWAYQRFVCWTRGTGEQAVLGNRSDRRFGLGGGVGA